MRHVTILAGFLALTACGPDVARPRIVSVQTQCNSEYGSTTDRHDLTYDDNRVSHIQSRWQMQYPELLIESSGMYSVQLTYSDDTLAAVSVTANGVTGGGTFVWADDTLSSATLNECDEEGCTSTNVSYTWTNDQLQREVAVVDGYNQAREYTWQDGVLQQIVTSWANDGEFEIDRFLYNDGTLIEVNDTTGRRLTFDSISDRLVLISDADGESWGIFYDEDGLISRITMTSDYDRCETTYTYGEGEVSGIVPVPNVPFGDRFDMRGRTMQRYEVLTSALFF